MSFTHSNYTLLMYHFFHALRYVNIVSIKHKKDSIVIYARCIQVNFNSILFYLVVIHSFMHHRHFTENLNLKFVNKRLIRSYHVSYDHVVFV